MGYPVFVRTDLASAKHDGPKSYRADSEEDLLRCVCRTFEDNACKDIVDFTRCWMFREFLNIGHSFTGFGGYRSAGSGGSLPIRTRQTRGPLDGTGCRDTGNAFGYGSQGSAGYRRTLLERGLCPGCIREVVAD